MNYKFKKWQKKMICSLYGDRIIFDQNDEMRDIKGRAIEYPDACEQFGIFEVRTTEQMGDLKLVDKVISSAWITRTPCHSQKQREASENLP